MTQSYKRDSSRFIRSRTEQREGAYKYWFLQSKFTSNLKDSTRQTSARPGDFNIDRRPTEPTKPKQWNSRVSYWFLSTPNLNAVCGLVRFSTFSPCENRRVSSMSDSFSVQSMAETWRKICSEKIRTVLIRRACIQFIKILNNTTTCALEKHECSVFAWFVRYKS